MGAHLNTAPRSCEAVEATNALRLPLGDAAIAINAILVALWTLLSTSTLVIFLRLRNQPALRVRSLPLLVISTIGIWCFVIAICFWSLFLDNFPCLLNLILWLLGPALQAAVSCAKLITLLFFTKIRSMGARVEHAFERSDSIATKSTTGASQVSNQPKLFFKLGRLPAIDFIIRLLSVTESLEVQPDKDQTVEVILTKQKHLLRFTSLVRITLILCIPSFITIGILTAAVPVYGSLQCIGCDVFIEPLAGTLACYVFLLILRLRITRIIRDSGIEDPFHFVSEMRISALFSFTSILVALSFLLTDPSDLQFNRQACWLWFIVIGSFFVYVNEFTRHAVAIAFAAVQTNATSAPASSRMVIAQILENDVIANRFERFAEAHFFGESVKFIRDARTFRTWSLDRPKDLVAAKAKAMVHLFIAQGGLLQVNISADARNKIEARVKAGDISPDLFKQAEMETLNLFRLSIWQQFVAANGLEGYASATAVGPGDKSDAHLSTRAKASVVAVSSTADSVV